MGKSEPDFSYERNVPRNYIVVGIDEVGRGAFAGPVVAAAVAISPDRKWEKLGIDDSKRLTARKREALAKIIREECLAVGIGEVGVDKINRYGIGKASFMAMRQAHKRLKLEKTYVLVDAFEIKFLKGVGAKRQKALVKGDQKSISIAAASIVAKVYRDELMERLYKDHKVYGWDKNKGYGTPGHIAAIKKQGLTSLHRKQFCHKL